MKKKIVSDFGRIEMANSTLDAHWKQILTETEAKSGAGSKHLSQKKIGGIANPISTWTKSDKPCLTSTWKIWPSWSKIFWPSNFSQIFVKINSFTPKITKAMSQLKAIEEKQQLLQNSLTGR